MEDYRLGHRIRTYKIEGFVDGKWLQLSKGQSVGRKKIDYFDEVEVSRVRLTVTKNVNEPFIRKLSVYYVEDFVAPVQKGISPWSNWQNMGAFNTKENATIEVDLSGKIKMPGQFLVQLKPESDDFDFKISGAKLMYDGHVVLDNFTTIRGHEININRTAQVTDESTIKLQLTIQSNSAIKGEIQFKPALIY